MGGNSQYLKFFRFYSIVDFDIVSNGEGCLWLIDSIFFIDLSEDHILDQLIRIGYTTKGAINYSELRNLEIDRYKRFCNNVMEFNKEINKKVGNA